MAGGGNKRDEGSITIQSTNLFAALDTRKKKKKTDKAGKSKGSSNSSSRQELQKEPEPQVFWAPKPLKVKSWADIDDDDEDDDYYATTAPIQSGWSTSEPSHTDAKDTLVEESESEEDILDEGDDDVEEEHEQETEVEGRKHGLGMLMESKFLLHHNHKFLRKSSSLKMSAPAPKASEP